MKILKNCLIGVGACLLVALGGVGIVALALGTERGTGWLFAALESRGVAGLSIGGVAGTLLGGVVLSDVRLAVGGHRLEVRSVAARWQAEDLLAGSVAFDELRVVGARYSSVATPTAAAPAGWRPRPWRVVVRRGVVDTLVLESAGGTVTLEGMAFAAEWRGDRPIAQQLTTRLGDFELQAHGELHLAEEPMNDGAFAWFFTGGALPVRGAGTLAGPFGRLELHHELSEPLPLTAHGEVALVPTPTAELRMRWSDLAWPGTPVLASPSGLLELSGGLDRYAFHGEGEVAIDGTDARFELQGSGDLQTVSLEALRLSGANGELAASGHLLWDAIRWDLAIKWRDLDPSVRWAGWPGRLRGQARLVGHLAPEFEWSASGLEVAGTIRGHPLTATGNVAARPDEWDLDVAVRSGPNAVTAAGSVGDALRVEVSLDAPSSEVLWPELTGALHINAALGGTPSKPDLTGELIGRGLRWRDLAVENLRVAATVAPWAVAEHEDAPLDIAVHGTGLRWRELAARAVSGRVHGRNEGHAVEAGVDAAHGTGRLRATGRLTPKGWSGSLEALAVDGSVVGDWRLAAPVAVAVGGGVVSLGDFCLAAQPAARMCGSARVSGTSDDRIEIVASHFELRSLTPLLRETVSAEGTYDVALRWRGPPTDPSASVSVAGGATRAVVRTAGETTTFGFDGLRLDATLEGDRIEVEGNVDAGASGRARIDARIDDAWGPDPGIRGSMHASWNELGFLSLLNPYLGTVVGELAVDLTVGGTLASPEVAAHSRLRGGSLSIPAWGIDIREVEGQAASTDLHNVSLAVRGRLGEGHAVLEGTTRLDPAAGWPTRLRLQGETLEAIRLPEAEIDLSPDLAVEIALPAIRVQGRVDVPRARLSLHELPAQAVAPSEDTVVHGIGNAADPRPPQVQADLQLTLGEDVAYAGGGLSTELSGVLDVSYDPGRATVARGVVELAGHYELAGQRLELERGKLVFAGPLDDPRLDVRAAREIPARLPDHEAAVATVCSTESAGCCCNCD